MTPQEAINQLDDLIKDRKSLMSGNEDYDEIYWNDIEALEIAKKAIEMQIPKPFAISVCGNVYYVCPNCKNNLDPLRYGQQRMLHCPECGQALDWDDESESTKKS